MMKHVDITFGVLGFLFSAFAYYYTGTFPEDMNGEIGIAYFPRIIIIGLGVCCLLLAITAFIENSSEKSEPFNLKNKGTQRAIICVAATVIYSLIITTFGFLACTVFFLFFLMFMLKERNYALMGTTSVLITGVVFTIFNLFLNITLPLGEIYGF